MIARTEHREPVPTGDVPVKRYFADDVNIPAEALGRAARIAETVRIKILGHEYDAARAAIDNAQREFDLACNRRPSTSLDDPITVLSLSVRTTNTLESIGIFTVGQLLATDRSALRLTPNLAERTMVEILSAARQWVKAAREAVGA